MPRLEKGSAAAMEFGKKMKELRASKKASKSESIVNEPKPPKKVNKPVTYPKK